MKKKIFWDTFVMALFGVLAAVLAVTYLMYREMYTNMEQEVRTEARFLSEAVRGEGKEYLERLDENGKHNRITLINPDGTVEYDNAAAASDMSNHLQRPEVQAAMCVSQIHWENRSSTQRFCWRTEVSSVWPGRRTV